MANDLLSDIEEFLAETGMSTKRFGLSAVGNGRLVERLRSVGTRGPGRVWPETEMKIRVFMASWKKRRAA